MATWLILLGGLLVWAAHFFILYGIGEFVGAGTGPRMAIVGLTLFCLSALGALAIGLARSPPRDDYDQWQMAAGRGVLLISAVGIAWQGLPALFP